MKDAVKSWILRGVALVILGPLAAGLWTSLAAPDGTTAATPILGTNFASGLFALAGLGFLCVIAGVLGAKALHRREGLLLAGLVMAWVAWAVPDMPSVYVSAGGGVYVPLAVEGALVLVLVVFVMSAVLKASGSGKSEDLFLGATSVQGALKAGAAKSFMIVGVSCVAVMAVAWLQVKSGMSGQALWGAAVGGMAAGLAGGFLGHSKGEAKNPVLVPCILGVALAGVVAPLVTMVMVKGPIEQAVATASLPGWGVVPSVAWGCGAIFGAPIGYGAVLGMIEKHGGVAQAA